MFVLFHPMSETLVKTSKLFNSIIERFMSCPDSALMIEEASVENAVRGALDSG